MSLVLFNRNIYCIETNVLSGNSAIYGRCVTVSKNKQNNLEIPNMHRNMYYPNEIMYE